MRPKEECSCGHLRDQHRRGWGPCVFQTTETLVGADGRTVWSGEIRCTCRRFIAANHPAGKHR